MYISFVLMLAFVVGANQLFEVPEGLTKDPLYLCHPVLLPGGRGNLI